ncbi:hypothetical protein [Ferrimonas pelagia]|uniref:MotA/TolQ/ExbB proton channel domain-containing protein n=1 Tax=Ferrimonas pelagia TaxID=1177826 RepID=A0ABP9FGH6_9GAMM
MRNWEAAIPWYMTIISTVTLMALAVFLTLNIEWFKTQAPQSPDWQSDQFQIHIHHLHLAMIKRSVGLFAGFAAMFIGMAVCFYSLKNQTQIDLGQAGLSVALATGSPGIIAMLLGGYLISATIQSKDHFADYPAKILTSGAVDEPPFPAEKG